MAKQVVFDSDARYALERGVNALANAVKVGDLVLFSKYAGTEWKHDGQSYMILTADRDILAILG